MEQESNQIGKKVLWQGAALLGGAALLSKLIGTMQKIPLQNLAGDEVFGLYSAVYALSVMWLTLASAGIPVAVSVLVAERIANGDESGAQRVVRWSLGLLCWSGLLMFVILWVGAEWFANLLGLESAAPAIRMSSLALLVAPATAVLRGYRQGGMQMQPPALSQLIEQTARVAFMLIAIFWAIQEAWSPSATAAAVHGGLAVGAIAGLITMLCYTGRKRNKPFLIRAAGTRKTFGAATSPIRLVKLPESRRSLLKRIITVAFPIAIASIVAPLLGLIDAFSIPRLLQQDDMDTALSLSQFGIYNRGVALLQLVIMGAAGAAAVLVPALTAARARGDEAAFTSRARFAMRLAWWIGGAAAVGLALLASPINIALFANGSGTAAMAIIALAAAGGTLQAVSAALLQGMGDLRSPAVNLAAAALLKLTLNAVLVPAYGIVGAAAAMAAAFAAAAVLNALSLRQRVQLPAPRLAIAWRSAAALAAMAAAVALLALGLGALTAALPERLQALLVALPGVMVGAIVFAAALVALGAIAPQEWRELPGLSGSRIERWLTRLHSAAHRNHKVS
ncbi:oligosaccharide flippase family protein [Cohnella sp.]|uniref:putative polysaccharide biosynthesis protein n=1 Tax=Cohnella sp. TaxID=1883426 RepID=UPI0035632537